MGQLDVHIRHGGGGGTYAIAVAVVAGFTVAAALAVGRAVAGIPAYVWPLAAAVVITGITVSVWMLMRSNRAQAAAVTARCEERRALEAAEAEARHRRRLEEREHQLAVAAASAPRVHTHVWPSIEAAQAAMTRTYTPATVITDQQEIQR